VNRTLKAALKIFHHNSQTTWDEDLHWLGMAFNTTIHDSHNITPDKLFLGRELRDLLQVCWNLTIFNDDGKGKDLKLFWAKAYSNLLQAKERIALRYNLDRMPHQYCIGDAVMYRLHLVSSKVHNVMATLLLKWLPPLTVAKFVRPNVVLSANPETGVTVRRAHVSQLKAYAD
jgi:hypothetical protein